MSTRSTPAHSLTCSLRLFSACRFSQSVSAGELFVRGVFVRFCFFSVCCCLFCLFFYCTGNYKEPGDDEWSSFGPGLLSGVSGTYLSFHTNPLPACVRMHVCTCVWRCGWHNRSAAILARRARPLCKLCCCNVTFFELATAPHLFLNQAAALIVHV